MGVGCYAVICVQDTDVVGHAEHGFVLTAEVIGALCCNHDTAACSNNWRVFRHRKINCLLAIL